MSVRKSDSIGELAKALKAFHAICPTITKSKTVDAGKFSYSYAPLPEILKAIAEPLDQVGLTFLQFPINDGDRIGVYTIVMHPESGEWIESEFATPIIGATCQDIGQMTSYYQRYGLNAAFGLAAEDDSDGRTAQPQRPSAYVQQGRPETREEMNAESIAGWEYTRKKFSQHCGSDEAGFEFFKELASYPDKETGKPVTPRKWDVSEKWQSVARGKLERHAAKCKVHEPVAAGPSEDDIPF